jgi:hypothetical protein
MMKEKRKDFSPGRFVVNDEDMSFLSGQTSSAQLFFRTSGVAVAGMTRRARTNRLRFASS